MISPSGGANSWLSTTMKEADLMSDPSTNAHPLTSGMLGREIVRAPPWSANCPASSP